MAARKFCKPEKLRPGDLVRLYLGVTWDHTGEPIYIDFSETALGLVLDQASPASCEEYFEDRKVFSERHFSSIGVDLLTEDQEVVTCTVAPHLVELLRRMR